MTMAMSPSFASSVRPLLQFTRPHTILGTLVSVPAIAHVADPIGSVLPGSFAPGSLCLSAILPSLLMNVFIVGVNQIHDVEIDRINKPHLPLPSGSLSKPTATLVCIGCLISSLLLSVASPLRSAPLSLTLLLSAAVGYAYSAPPFRWKRHPLSAAACIVFVRGFLANWGFFHHARAHLPACAGAYWPNGWVPLSIFYSVYALSIAVEKDTTDVEGDARHGISTFSTMFGGGMMPLLASRSLLVLIHAAFALAFVNTFRAASFLLCCNMVLMTTRLPRRSFGNGFFFEAEQEEKKRVLAKSYQLLWKGFYFTYVILLFAV